MEKLKASEIKIGILSDIKKEIIRRKQDINYYVEYHGGSRGILFVKTNENMGRDIIYPINEYPILSDNSLRTSIIRITKYEELEPLFKYYGLTELSSEDLKKFLDEILLNKKWFKEHCKLFGYNVKNFGFFNMAYSTPKMREEAILPENLGEVIHDVHNHDGLRLLKKERKMYELR